LRPLRGPIGLAFLSDIPQQQTPFGLAGDLQSFQTSDQTRGSLAAIARQAFTSQQEDRVDVSEEMLRNLHHASPSTGWLRMAEHERDFSEASPALQDRAPLTEDPESPRDIVHENVLVLLPLALFFLFLLFGLVIAFSE
jgi:hypothetical protein